MQLSMPCPSHMPWIQIQTPLAWRELWRPEREEHAQRPWQKKQQKRS